MRAQFLLAKCGVAGDFKIGLLRDSLLLFRLNLLLLFFLLLLRELDRALAAGEFSRQAQKEENTGVEKTERTEARPSRRTCFRISSLFAFRAWSTHSLTKPDEIFDQASETALHAEITDQHNIIAHLIARGRGLLPGARIDIAKLNIEPAEK